MKVCLGCNNTYVDDCDYCGCCNIKLNEENTVHVDLKNPEQFYLSVINEKLERIQTLEKKIDNIESIASFWFMLKVISLIMGGLIIWINYEVIKKFLEAIF